MYLTPFLTRAWTSGLFGRERRRRGRNDGQQAQNDSGRYTAADHARYPQHVGTVVNARANRTWACHISRDWPVHGCEFLPSTTRPCRACPPTAEPRRSSINAQAAEGLRRQERAPKPQFDPIWARRGVSRKRCPRTVTAHADPFQPTGAWNAPHEPLSAGYCRPKQTRHMSSLCERSPTKVFTSASKMPALLLHPAGRRGQAILQAGPARTDRYRRSSPR